jgi:hypothetical protein
MKGKCCGVTVRRTSAGFLLCCIGAFALAGCGQPGSEHSASDGLAASTEPATRTPGDAPPGQEMLSRWKAAGGGDAPVAVDSLAQSSPKEAGKVNPNFQWCDTFYGSCTGRYGTSCAYGDGWVACATGSFLYTWLTICDGNPTGYGTGFCFW